MYNGYKYIHATDKIIEEGGGNEKVIEDDYKSISELISKCVIYSTGKGYRIYRTHTDYVNDLLSLPESDRVFHEVIFSNEQKLKFDIDAPIELINKFNYDSNNGVINENNYKTINKNINNDIDDIITDNIITDNINNNISDIISDNITNNITDNNVVTSNIIEFDEYESNLLDYFLPINENINEITTERDNKVTTESDNKVTAEISNKVTTEIKQENVIQDIQTNIGLTYKHIFDTIMTAIKDAFFTTYYKELSNKDIVIAESNGADKYSNHIIITNYKVSNHHQAMEFSRKVISYLPEPYHEFYDASVYKSIQNFRSPLCHKTGGDRVMKIVSAHNVLDALITHTRNCEHLSDLIKREQREYVAQLPPGDAATVVEYCSNAITDHVFKCQHGDMFIFTRTHPGECIICKTTHDADNSALVTTRIVEGYVHIYFQCRRYVYKYGKDGNHYVKLHEFESEMLNVNVNNVVDDMKKKKEDTAIIDPATANTLSANNKYKLGTNIIRNFVDKTIVMNIGRRNLFPMTTLFDNCVDKNIYDEPTLRPFELVETLVVHAAMKMGKTKALSNYLTTYYKDGFRKHIIRFVSFRQTFSSNIKEKFPDFALYSDTKGALTDNRLIVQVESLWRIEPGLDPPDLMILDECESIFEQFDSGLLRGNFNDCFAVFTYLLKFSRRVVLMDAGISDRTARILAQMRPGPVFYHHNTHANARDDKYFFSGDKIKWLGVLYHQLDCGNKIACPMSSYAEAKILEKAVKKKYPGKSVKIYSSESTPSEKTVHFGDVNKFWAEYDVLIYTPTVTAGVSFERKHFESIFGYFTDRSCNVETDIQMIGRIRDVATRKHFLCLAATGNNLPIEVEDIQRFLKLRRENLFKDFDHSGLIPEYGHDGLVKYKVMPYFHVWIENIRMRNISKNFFVKRFIHNIAITAATTSFLSDELFKAETGYIPYVNNKFSEKLQEIADAHAESKREIAEIECRAILNASDIDANEAAAIRMTMQAQLDVSDEQRAMYERYRLISDYNYPHILTEKFVNTYRDIKTRRAYHNWNRISTHDDLDTALENIRLEEVAMHKYFMDNCPGGVNKDLNHNYVYDHHQHAISYLRMCGFNTVTDECLVHKNIVAITLRNNEKKYWDNLSVACVAFEIRLQTKKPIPDDGEYIKYMLIPINKMLKKMYEINISTKRGDTNSYMIYGQNLFTYSLTEANAKKIPLIKRGPKEDKKEQVFVDAKVNANTNAKVDTNINNDAKVIEVT